MLTPHEVPGRAVLSPSRLEPLEPRWLLSTVDVIATHHRADEIGDKIAPYYVMFDATQTATAQDNVTNGLFTGDLEDLVLADFRWTIDGNPGQGVRGETTERVGFVAGHVFQESGYYDVSVEVTAPDGVSTGTYDFGEIHVNKDYRPDSGSLLPSGITTYYVSPNGDNSDGLTEATAFQTADKVETSLFGSGFSNARILFERGNTFVVNNKWTFGGSHEDIYIGAYGVGADPVLDQAAYSGSANEMFRFSGNAKNIVFEGIKLVGEGVFGSGPGTDPNKLSAIRFMGTSTPENILVNDVEATSFSERFLVNEGGANSAKPLLGVGVFNSYFYDTSRYVTYIGGDSKDIALVNNTIENLTGGEHAFRFQGARGLANYAAPVFDGNNELVRNEGSDGVAERIYIADNDVKTNADAGAKSSFQVRGHNRFTVIENNRVDRVISFKPGNASDAETVQYGLAEGNLIYLDTDFVNSANGSGNFAAGQVAFEIKAQDIAIRNNVIDNYDRAVDASTWKEEVLESGVVVTKSRASDDIYVHHNTLIARDSGEAFDSTQSTLFNANNVDDHQIYNNLAVRGRPTYGATSGTLGTVKIHDKEGQPGATPWENNATYGNTVLSNEAAADFIEREDGVLTVEDYRVGEASLALEEGVDTVGGDQVPVFFDADGQVRSDATPDAGAFEEAISAALAHWKFDEASGATATDSIGSLDGTLTNGVTRITGVESGALQFDGVNDHVQVSSFDTPDGSFTVAAWVKSDTSEWNATNSILWKNDSFMIGGNQATGVGTPLRFYVRNVSSSSWESVGGPLTGHDPSFDITEWHHYAGTYDSYTGELTLYVDGVRYGTPVQGTPGLTASQASGVMWLGGNQSNGKYLDGGIDDARLYDRALSGFELAQLADATGDPVARWELDESSGTLTADSQGDLDGTLTNGVTRVSGVSGNALQFDGTNDHVAVGSFPSPEGSFTVAAWVKSDTSEWNATNSILWKSDSFMLGGNQATGAGMPFRFYVRNTTTSSWESVGGALTAIDPAFDITGWHHYTGTYDAVTGELRLYVDGELYGSVSGTKGLTQSHASGAMWLGGNQNNAKYFDGAIDDVALYNRVLNPFEISQLSQ